MNKIKLISASIVILSSTILYAIVQPKASAKQSIAPQKKTKCCSIQRTFKNLINLSQICVQDNITKLELQIISPYTMCTNLDDIGLTDENGKSYKPKSMHNIPSCPEIIQVNRGHKFYWYFEPLDKGITTLNLIENKYQNLPPTFPNWEFWYWKDISVSHCKF